MEPTATVSNIQAIIDFAIRSPGLFMATVAFICILIFGVLFTIYKIIAYIVNHTKGFKIGDKELKMGDDSDPIQEVVKNTENIAKFNSTIAAVIRESIQTGYNHCERRQRLFDSQMDKVIENFDMAQTLILDTYISNNGLNTDIAKALLNYCINKTIINKFRDICIADRLTEKTKDGILEINHQFIENAFTDLRIELRHLINYSVKENSNNKSYKDEILISSVDSHRDTIKRFLVSSLEFAYDAAVSALGEVEADNKKLNNTIKQLLNIHLEGVTDNLQEEWLGSNTLPPNYVIGR